MFLTEEKAMTKWCPMAMVILEAQIEANAGNRIQNLDGTTSMHASARCVGRDCMAWVDGPYVGLTARNCEDPLAVVEPPRPERLPDDWKFQPSEPGDFAYWVEPEASRLKRQTGRCGLINIHQG